MQAVFRHDHVGPASRVAEKSEAFARSTRWHTGTLLSASADTPLLMDDRDPEAAANREYGVPGSQQDVRAPRQRRGSAMAADGTDPGSARDHSSPDFSNIMPSGSSIGNLMGNFGMSKVVGSQSLRARTMLAHGGGSLRGKLVSTALGIATEALALADSDYRCEAVHMCRWLAGVPGEGGGGCGGRLQCLMLLRVSQGLHPHVEAATRARAHCERP